MTKLNTADKIYSGTSIVSKVYSGTNLVWPSVTYDAVTQAWINEVVGAGGSVSSGRKTLVNDLVLGLKADAIFTKFDRLYLFAAENVESAYRDLIAPTAPSQAQLGFPTFTANRGFTTDAGNYIRINFFMVTNAVAFSQNSAHFSFWSLTSGPAANAVFNPTSGVGAQHIFPEYSGGDCYARTNEASSTAFTTGGATGLIVGNRSDASTIQAYRNGSSLGSQSIASTAPPNEQLYMFSRQIAAFSVGGSMNVTQQTAYYNRLRTYMTAVGVP